MGTHFGAQGALDFFARARGIDKCALRQLEASTLRLYRSNYPLVGSEELPWDPRASSGAHPMGPGPPGVKFWSSRAHPMDPGALRGPDSMPDGGGLAQTKSL